MALTSQQIKEIGANIRCVFQEVMPDAGEVIEGPEDMWELCMDRVYDGPNGCHTKGVGISGETLEAFRKLAGTETGMKEIRKIFWTDFVKECRYYFN